MIRVALALLLALALTDAAAACGGCGLFGNRCRFHKPVVAVAPVVYPPQANVFVIQNSYPVPLVPPGTTGYQSIAAPIGYQGAVLPFLDPNRYFDQELQLMKAADQTAALRSQRTSALLERIAALQAPAIERLAAGQSAQMVLSAAGLNPAAPAQAQQQAVVISHDAYGRIQVAPVTPQQLAAMAADTRPAGALPAVPPPTPGVAAAQQPAGAGNGKHPALAQFCGKCHGVDVAQPKKGLFLGDDAEVARGMKAKFFAIARAVGSRTMPPASEPQPNDQQRAAILDEIESIIVARAGDG